MFNVSTSYFSFLERAKLSEFPSSKDTTPIDVANKKDEALCVACFHGKKNQLVKKYLILHTYKNKKYENKK